MVLGGMQKTSLIDYPEKTSCVLFFSGCNFSCPYCHNPDLARNCGKIPSMSEEKTVYDFLEKRKGFLDGVVISGGEPTLQEDLFVLCEKVKKMGYPVKLDTNGSRPKVLQRLIKEGLVDYIAMDVKTDPLRYSPLIQKGCDPSRILSSIRLIMESSLPYEFKTTCIKPLVDARVVESISRLINGARLYALQQFRHTDVLQPEFFENDTHTYQDHELIDFQSIAQPYVRRCITR